MSNQSSSTDICIDEKAEFEYMPSNWSCDKHASWTPQERLADYLNTTGDGAKYVYNKYSDHITTISYGSRSNECIDIVSPIHNERKTPSLLAYFHGGYWQEGYFRSNSMHLARPIVESGHSYAGVGYLDSSEQLSLEDIVDQAVRAVNKLAEYAAQHGIRSVVLSGHSAGAHLVCMVGLSPLLNSDARRLITGIAALSGVYDIIPLLSTSVNISGLSLRNELTARQLSPLHKLASEPVVLDNLGSVLVGYGECESNSFKAQSTDFAKVLKEKGLPAQLQAFPSQDHFTLISDAQYPEDPLAKVLMSLLTS